MSFPSPLAIPLCKSIIISLSNPSKETVSEPSFPSSTSSPPFPDKVSLPSKPIKVLLSSSPVIVSFPAEPVIFSIFLRPSTIVFPFLWILAE